MRRWKSSTVVLLPSIGCCQVRDHLTFSEGMSCRRTVTVALPSLAATVPDSA